MLSILQGQYFSSPLMAMALILGLLLASWALSRICFVFLKRALGPFLSKAHLPTELTPFRLPLSLCVFGLFLKMTLPLTGLFPTLLVPLLTVASTISSVGIVMLAYKGVSLFGLFLEERAKRSAMKIDGIFIPFVTKALKVAVVTLGAILIGQSFSLDMGGIIAGMGIGGIALALAAKDTISNLFGSLTVLVDRPFKIGDVVKIGDSIEGVIERVGLRSTRIRTFYDSLVTLPNGQLSSVHIDNFGQRTYRRLRTHIGVEYGTPPEKLEAFCEGIREIIRQHPHTRKDYFHCYFHRFGDSALELILYVFWKVPDWSAELSERHRLLLDIFRLGHKLNVNFAFPTRTLHIAKESEQVPPQG